jgi:hypothetical protein
VHFRGLVQQVAIAVYRLFSALRSLWNLSAGVVLGPTNRPMNLVDIMANMPPSLLLSLVEAEYGDTDAANVAELVLRIRVGILQVRQVVAYDLHENCPEVDSEVEEALGDNA